MADSYRHKSYIRGNYRRAGRKFDYGEVEAILNKTFTYSVSAYYTAFGNIFQNELGTSTGICSARVAWVNPIVGTHKNTSVVGAAVGECSYNAQIHAYISFTTSNGASMLIRLAEYKKETVSTLLADGGETFAVEVTFFVVSR
jgi:hypothetical protein